MNTHVNVNNLKKSFGKLTALNGLNLTVEPGSIVGLIGPNGAGKSTLIRSLMGLVQPDAGSIELFEGLTPHSFASRKRIGYMPQSMSIYEDLTVSENLKFFGHLYALDNERIKKRTNELLRILQLEEKRNKPTRELSGGMKRRLMLATAVIHDPELLMLDEPTAGVDPLLRLEFWKWFEVMAHTGKSILISTHHIAEAVRCSRVIFLRQGTILEEGTPAELIKKHQAKDLEEAFVRASQVPV